MNNKTIPNTIERTLNDDDYIVSKTDTKGRITYANRIFMTLSSYTEQELLGAPHNIVRHPDMPGLMFKRLWDTLRGGREFHFYTKNLAKDGSYYWVFANVTPSFDQRGQPIGYFSVRRKPKAAGVKTFQELYRSMRQAERRTAGKQAALAASARIYDDFLAAQGANHEAFILALQA
ncbi:PAS domain-containing protein [Rhabdochromatium marinum]|uniref:PAS domain-containing protein n=1 Tax=Rhabdochromatium marinum TaxID=48729 RepID=UPI0019068744|nr:PAS domain-containing protein [Rhabdochromatium marinum]MBK1648850.1 aerotaxis receptor Aer [Rhabdochromatium marinum]